MSRISDFLTQCVQEGCCPGMQYAVGGSGGIVEQGCIGTLDGETPVTYDSLYDMASLTKIFTTLAVARLLEQGKLCLGDTLDRFLPETDDFFPIYEGNEKGKIPLLELMTHTSKISGMVQLFRVCQDRERLLEAIRIQRPRDMAAAPVEYSCSGFILLGEVIARITGDTLDQAVEKLVIQPLGMERTCFNPGGELLPQIAPTEFCRWRNRLIRGEVHDENAYVMGGVAGNAGIFSNVRDIVRICEAMLTGSARDGKRFLHRRTIEMMTMNYTPGMGASRGVGWEIHAGPGMHPAGDLFRIGSFGHTGFTGTSLYIDPSQDLFTVLISNRIFPDRTNEKFFRCRRIFNNLAVLEYAK